MNLGDGMNRPEANTSPLDPAVCAFFDAAEDAGYEKRRGKRNISLLLKGRFIGGWNTVEGHWYITAVTAIGHEAKLDELGFGTHNRKRQGVTWILRGAARAPTFKTALRHVAGVPVG